MWWWCTLLSIAVNVLVPPVIEVLSAEWKMELICGLVVTGQMEVSPAVMAARKDLVRSEVHVIAQPQSMHM